MTRPIPQQGEIYRHFKGPYYYIFGTGHHSETSEKLVVYKVVADTPEQLAHERAMIKMFPPSADDACIRPLDMFLSEVDRIKYPDVKQKFRFEKVEF